MQNVLEREREARAQWRLRIEEAIREWVKYDAPAPMGLMMPDDIKTLADRIELTQPWAR